MPKPDSALCLHYMARAAISRSAALSCLTGFIAVDATLGNGYDTLFLAGVFKKVLAMDVQRRALKIASRRIAEAGAADRARLILDGHENMAAWLEPGEKIGAVMFNLGFLPGSDRKIVTRPDTTITALETVLPRLAPGALASVHIYRGHRGGQEEYEAVQNFVKALPESDFQVLRCESANKRINPEALILMENRAIVFDN